MGEAIRVIAGVNNPISGYTELIHRSQCGDTVDADSRRGIDVEDLALTVISGQAILPVVL